MSSIKVIYFSVLGNTEAFVEKITPYAKQQHALKNSYPLIESKKITDHGNRRYVNVPFFLFMPSYKISSENPNFITKQMLRYLLYRDNFKNCLGVVGFGDRNYGSDYCCTPKQYSSHLGIPMVNTVEIRGARKDIVKTYNRLVLRFRLTKNGTKTNS